MESGGEPVGLRYDDDEFLYILAKLPIKYLMQLRCVCKLWQSIIDNPSFGTFYKSHCPPGEHYCALQIKTIRLDLLRAIVTEDYLEPPVVPLSGTEDSEPLVAPLSGTTEDLEPLVAPLSGTTEDLEPLVAPLSGTTEDLEPSVVPLFGTEDYLEPLVVPLSSLDGVGYHILSHLHSCNGFLLFTCKHKACFAVVNPLRKGFINLPRLEHDPQCRRICGFGWDESIRRFKVICVHEDNETKAITTLVHTLGTASWEKIEERPPRPISEESVYADGSLHWLVQSPNQGRRRRLIVSFDVGKEKFRFTPHPEFSSSDSPLFGLVVLKGNLGIADHSGTSEIDIWVLKEENHAKRWTQEYRIGVEENVWERKLEGTEWKWKQDWRRFGVREIKVIGLWKEGEILLQSSCGGLLVYDVESERIRRHDSLWTSSRPKVVCHRPSLIPVHSIM